MPGPMDIDEPVAEPSAEEPMVEEEEAEQPAKPAKKLTTFANCDMELWEPCDDAAPAELPKVLQCLDVFAGCGGLHMDGVATFEGDNQLRLKTICAVEIEQTYKTNFPDTNVLTIGIGRFLATARRLHKLKTAADVHAPKGIKIMNLRIDTDVAQKKDKDKTKKKAASTKDKQDKDDVTLDQVKGIAPIPWLSFLVRRDNADKVLLPTGWARDRPQDKWETDKSNGELEAAIHHYLNSSSFTPNKFPLPGDVQILSGGPPCQGWSGYNTQRIHGKDLSDLMEDSENRLLGRFLEVVWLYRPLYVIMEEVPDVATKGNVMEWMDMVYARKGYSMKYDARMRTGLYGCPQTRDRLIVIATLNGLSPVELPAVTHSNYKDDEDELVRSFDSSKSCYPLEMKKEGKQLLRTLVLGDSLSCDLPIAPAEFRGANKNITKMEEAKCTYVTEPPTPFIAYLRQDCDEAQVTNHVVYRLGLSDRLRSNCVPFHKDASWREMAGDHHVASMLQPMMMVLTDEEWEGGDGIASRWCGKIPDFMRKTEKKKSTMPKNEIPPLRHNWEMESHRFPLVPYWCLTMKHGKDHGCYGRLQYDRPHDTVHSYHKPHWHPSLVPFDARVMSVREKARVQGFPDSFVFRGDVNAMYKQIGNAVSPQLTKALARTVLSAHCSSLGEGYQGSATYSQSLETFAEYFENYDVEKMPKLDRHSPKDLPRPKLEPMTYEEILVEYNTETRSDHSSRYNKKTPFELLDEVDQYRNWILDSIHGIRRIKDDDGKSYFEVCVKYPGWPEGYNKWWVDMVNGFKNTRQWTEFEKVDPEKVEAVLCGKRQAFCLEGCDANSQNVAPPALEEAQAKFELYKARYAEDKAKGWVYGGKTLTQYGNVKKAVNEDDEGFEVVGEGCGKGKWVSKKREIAEADDDAEEAIEWARLLGTRVSVWWDLYGWSEGVIVKVEGKECKIAYVDGSEEDVTLPDDTIRIVEYHKEGEPILTKEQLIAENKAKEEAEKAKEEAEKVEANGVTEMQNGDHQNGAHQNGTHTNGVENGVQSEEDEEADSSEGQTRSKRKRGSLTNGAAHENVANSAKATSEEDDEEAEDDEEEAEDEEMLNSDEPSTEDSGDDVSRKAPRKGERSSARNGAKRSSKRTKQ